MYQTDRVSLLLVDDDSMQLDLTADMLARQKGRFSVEKATGASEGLDRVTADSFDGIISDYDMPRQNGIEFLETVREQYPDLPFFLFTGKGSEEVASDALSAGATDYLQKGGGSNQYELLANRVQNAVEQFRAKQRADELERIDALVRDITQALVRADSRSAAETRVCEHLSESDPYLFAWIGSIDSDTKRITPRAWAGIQDGYLDSITVTADETATGRGPGGTAIRERRVAAFQNIHEDPDFEPWREDALERGYQSVAGVPLEYGDSLYGVLLVYSDRVNAFDADERALLADLGDDIAHTIHAQEVKVELETTRHRFQALTENSGLGVITIDAGHTIRHANDVFAEILGYAPDELIGESLFTIMPERYHDDHQQAFDTYLDGGIKQVDWSWIELQGRHSDGHEVPLGLSFGEATVNGETHFTAVVRDITERKERERNLERFKNAVDHAGHAVYVTGSDGTIEYVNPSFETITGYSADEAVGRNPRILKSGEMSDSYYEELWETLLDGELWEEVVINCRKDGEKYHAHQTIAPILDENDDIDDFVAIQTDITEQKGREEALKASRNAYKDLFNGIKDAVFVHEPSGEFIAVNNAACERLGYSNDELLELSPSDIDAPEYADTAPDRIAAIEMEGTQTFESAHLTKSGERIPVEIASTQIEYFGKDAILSVARDITDRKQKSRELVRKNERLDQFAGVVSHDLRNPLNVAQGRIELARDECDSTHLGEVANAHKRMQALIDNLLTLARTGTELSDVEDVNMANMIDSSWRTVETGGATLMCEIDRRIRADPSRLQQLLENLIRNAIDHSEENVTVTVGQLRDGFYVADDGPGIPKEEREQVFEMGVTSSTRGTGFGLSIVARIVDSHGWDISVTESSKGGSRFEISGVEFAG